MASSRCAAAIANLTLTTSSRLEKFNAQLSVKSGGAPTDRAALRRQFHERRPVPQHAARRAELDRQPQHAVDPLTTMPACRRGGYVHVINRHKCSCVAFFSHVHRCSCCKICNFGRAGWCHRICRDDGAATQGQQPQVKWPFLSFCGQMAIPFPFVAKWPFLFLLWLGRPFLFLVTSALLHSLPNMLQSSRGARQMLGIFESKNAVASPEITL